MRASLRERTDYFVAEFQGRRKHMQTQSIPNLARSTLLAGATSSSVPVGCDYVCDARLVGFVELKGDGGGFKDVSRVRIYGRRRSMLHSPYPVSQFPHGQRFVEVLKASDGELVGQHVKWHNVERVDRRLVVQDDVWWTES